MTCKSMLLAQFTRRMEIIDTQRIVHFCPLRFDRSISPNKLSISNFHSTHPAPAHPVKGLLLETSGNMPIFTPTNQQRTMEKHITREAALELLKKYNKDPFHLRHALTVEAVMRWYAKQLGFAEEEDFWGIVGLLHDIDFEMYPEEHCIKAPELLREGGVGEEMIHAICSHAYGMHVDVKPEHLMEKVLFATDELTGLIWATALMRPSKSVQDMELKSLKKKYKVKTFAAGCSREVIEQGAEMLGWPLDEVLQKTLDAMKANEAKIAEENCGLFS